MASLCSISKRTILQSVADLNKTQVVSVQLLSEDKLQTQVSANTQSARDSAPVSIVSSLAYLTAMTKSNSFISALGTNYYVLTGINQKNLHLYSSVVSSVYYGGDDGYPRMINPIIPLHCKLCYFRCSLYSVFP
jgi:hypothetical protein